MAKGHHRFVPKVVIPDTEWATLCKTAYPHTLLHGAHRHICGDFGIPIDTTSRYWPCCLVAYRTLPRRRSGLVTVAEVIIVLPLEGQADGS